MPGNVSISQSGQHGAIADSDRIPASKGPFTPGTRGYHQLSAIRAIIVTPNTPARTLNSAGYQPSTTNNVLVTYSIRITCTASLAGGQDGKVELMSDSNSTPTAIRATIQNRNSVSLAIALTAINEQTAVLSYLVPVGHYVRLISTTTTGTPTFAIISQTEEIIS